MKPLYLLAAAGLLALAGCQDEKKAESPKPAPPPAASGTAPPPPAGSTAPTPPGTPAPANPTQSSPAPKPH